MKTPTPYYQAYPNVFKSNIKRLKDAIIAHYPNYKLAYSFKTNYCRVFLEAANELDALAEVVSAEEYLLACESGFKPSDIIWNGVIPSDFKHQLIVDGGIVNVDNMHELMALIKKWRDEQNTPMPVGLRFDISDLFNSESRFGFSKNEIPTLLQMKYGEIDVRCVHCHVSNARDLDSFRIRVRKMAELANMFNAPILDLGGNMYGPMHPDYAMQYESFVPSLEDYGLVIGQEMKNHFPNEDVTLITENGTALVGNAMDLVATVIKIDKRNFFPSITLDCRCYDVGFSCNHKNPVIETCNVNADKILCAKVYGCTCLERDIIHRNFSGQVNVGDTVTIKNVGAYSVNVSNDFISSKPIIKY